MRAPPAKIGSALGSVWTPALLVSMPHLEQNEARMRTILRGTGVALLLGRPGAITDAIAVQRFNNTLQLKDLAAQESDLVCGLHQIYRLFAR